MKPAIITDQQFRELGREIAKRLGPDWQFVNTAERDDATWYELKCKDGRALHVGREYNHKERVSVSACGWPSYTTISRDWRMSQGVSRQQVTPSNLSNPNEDTPRATIAYERGVDAICKEIARRILPDYNRIWARCQEQARESQAYQDGREAAWARLCAAAGADASKPTIDFIGGLDIAPSSASSFHVERGGSVDAEDAIAIVEFLKARKALKKGVA